MLLQLDPVIPVRIVGGKGWSGPTGTGMAIGWWQVSIEHNLVWIVVMDETGQIWEIENPFVRARTNITWGRPNPDKEPSSAGPK